MRYLIAPVILTNAASALAQSLPVASNQVESSLLNDKGFESLLSNFIYATDSASVSKLYSQIMQTADAIVPGGASYISFDGISPGTSLVPSSLLSTASTGSPTSLRASESGLPTSRSSSSSVSGSMNPLESSWDDSIMSSLGITARSSEGPSSTSFGSPSQLRSSAFNASLSSIDLFSQATELTDLADLTGMSVLTATPTSALPLFESADLSSYPTALVTSSPDRYNNSSSRTTHHTSHIAAPNATLSQTNVTSSRSGKGTNNTTAQSHSSLADNAGSTSKSYTVVLALAAALFAFI